MQNETSGFNSIVVKSDNTGPDAPGTVPVQDTVVSTAPESALVPIPVEPEEAAPASESQPSSDRPQWLPEKFKSAEDLAAAYAALEKKLGQPDAKAESSTAPSMETALNTYADEYSRTGALSDKSYGELAKLGMPKKVVDAYIAGQQAIGAKLQTEVHSVSGGADNYREMVNWAASNMSKAEIAAYNASIASGDHAAIMLAVRGLAGAFAASGGSVAPKVRLEGRGGAQSSQPFRSRTELTAAMSDPRYKRDAAYRADVEARLSKSNIL